MVCSGSCKRLSPPEARVQDEVSEISRSYREKNWVGMLRHLVFILRAIVRH